MLFGRFDVDMATKIALPPNTHSPFFSEEEAATTHPLAQYVISEICTAINHWRLLTFADGSVDKLNYEESLAMMRVTISSLPFQAVHEKSFGWLRGLAADLPTYAVPETLFENLRIRETPSYLLGYYAHEYAQRLCQDIGTILYDYADAMEEMLPSRFHLSITDCQDIKITLLRYLDFAMTDLQRALAAPVPYLIAYPYTITSPDAKQDAVDADEEYEAFKEFMDFETFQESEILLPTSYTPSIECYCVWDAAREAYIEHALWQDWRFKPIFTEGLENLFPTATATFFDTIKTTMEQNACEDDFVAMSKAYMHASGTSPTSPANPFDDLFSSDDELFYPEEDENEEDDDDCDNSQETVAAMLNELFGDADDCDERDEDNFDEDDFDEDDFDEDDFDEDDFDD